ncbi:Alpha-amylase A type-3 [Elsinoe australis]|uniref:alpha-amylase n=1 Tax=Elsinoe australis TaxID=40998 RepID=A0A2P8ADZ5_9PEZI|nr:Alpha-amylase A type-3 [Elsinoe australis]
MKAALSLLLPVVGLFSASVNAATAEEWRSQSIYQLLTDRYAREDGSTTATCNTNEGKYCGGTWRGVISKLDYIQSLGFTAIWISPVTANIEGRTAYGEAFHGYWQNDLYSVNSHFGTPDDLRALSDAVHERGMYLMVDIVVNHNGWNGAPSTVDYSSFKPFNSPDDYHSYCTIDYNNSTSIQDCWLGDTQVPLPDLKTESPTVASGYQTWISQLVSNYSIDGLRLDTALQVNPTFWSPFHSSAGIFMTGELYNGDPTYVCPYQSATLLPSILNFPSYYAATSAFSSTSGSISALASHIPQMQATCADVTVLGHFSENHDLPRFAFLTGDKALAKNLLAYTLLGDGIPIVYQGQEQGYAAVGQGSNGNDPFNREALWFSGYNEGSELAVVVKGLNGIRKWAGGKQAGFWSALTKVVQSDGGSIVLRRGDVLMVLTNGGAGAGEGQLVVDDGEFEAGSTVVDVLGCGEVQVADGNLTVPMEGGLPRVLYPKSSLGGSGICGN